MKTFLKVILWLAIGFVGLLVLFYIIGSIGSEDREERLARLQEKHCQITFEDSDRKAQLLDEIIDNPDINATAPMGIALGKALRSSVKYPSTLEVEGDKFDGYLFLNKNDAIDIDTTAGTWTYLVNFRSQNKLSQMVRSQMRIMCKYEAGCQPLEIVDIQVE